MSFRNIISKAFSSLGGKLLAFYLPAVGLGMIVFFGAVEYRTYKLSQADLAARLESFTQLQARVLAPSAWNYDDAAINQILTAISNDPDFAFVVVRGKSGELIAQIPDSGRNFRRDILVAEQPLIQESFGKDVNIGHVEVGFSEDGLQKRVVSRLKSDTAILLVSMLLVALITLGSTRLVIIRPLARLLESMTEAKESGRREPVIWESQDEVGTLVRSYNELQETQAAAEADLQRRNVLANLLHYLADSPSSAGNVDAVIQLCLEELGRYLDFDVGHVYSVDALNGALTAKAIWYFDDPENYAGLIGQLGVLETGEGELARVCAEIGEQQWSSDLSNAVGAAGCSVLEEAQLQSAYVFPITIGTATFAVLEFFGRSPEPPSQFLAEVMPFIGPQIGRIVEHKISEDALRQSQKGLADAQRIAQMGSWEFDIEAGKLSASDETYRIFGHESSGTELTYQSMVDQVHPDDRHVIDEVADELRRGREELDSEYRLILPNDDVRVVRSVVRMETDPETNSRRIIGTIQDVTQTQKTEQALRQAQKMETVGQLAGGVAHDFNNILGIVMGNLELAEMELENPKAARSFLQSALKGTERGAALTSRLLSFARRGGGDEKHTTEPTDVNDVIREIESLVARTITSSIAVDTQLAEGIWLTEINQGDLQDVILNLALNARDAMPDGGNLSITTSNKVLDDEYVKLNPGGRPGEHVLITVSDNGTGMKPEVLEHVFEPFYSTKAEGKGTGLGLSMVYAFCNHSGGHVGAYSSVGIGTTFNLYLPRSDPFAGRQGLSADAEAAMLPRGHERVLVVDDEPELVDIARVHMEKLGYTVVTAESGAEAIDILKAEPNIDLVFSDVVMPGGVDGYGLARAATAINPALKVLLTSGYVGKHIDDWDQQGSLEHQLTLNRLSKPYTQAELAYRIRESLDAGR